MSITDFLTWAASNEMLVAGVGTVTVGGLAYVVRSVPSTIQGLLKRWLTTSLTVTTRNHEFGDVSRLVNECRIPALMRNFMPSYREKGVSPGYGMGWGRYKGVFFTFNREMLEGKGLNIEERLDIRFFTRNTAIVTRFLDEAEDYREPGKLKMYSSQGGWFEMLPQKPKRPLHTVFASQEVKSAIVDRMRWFIENEQYFLDRGIPYKFCSLLFGPPGTGKTSLVHAVASEFGLNILHINSLDNIDRLIQGSNSRKDLIVIEDIDALADDLSRKKEEGDEAPAKKIELKLGDEDGKPILHKLLNSLDGFCTPHGLKVMITTNHVEKLDKALVRPGRMDVMLEIGALGENEIIEMFEAFHGAGAADRLRRHRDAGGRIEVLPGSELQELFANKSADEAIARLSSEVEKAA